MYNSVRDGEIERLPSVSTVADGIAVWRAGVPFAALFVLVFQGGLTLLAGELAPFLSTAVVTEMSAVGGVILVGMGINMLELSPRRIKVANMLPAIFLPIAYVPLSVWIVSLFS